MKESIIIRCLVMLAALLAKATIKAQENTEYYPEGTTWEETMYYEVYSTGECWIYDNYRSTVSGDTVIDGVTYKRVVVEKRILEDKPIDWYNPGPWHWEYYETYGIRENNGLIYKRIPGRYYNKEYFAYDFNDWCVGKSIPTNEWDFDKLLDKIVIKYATIDSLTNVTMKDGSQELCIVKDEYQRQIRGIGYREGIFRVYGYAIWGPGAMFFGVLNFTRNGVLIYEWDPSEILGVKKLSENEASSKATYSLTGVRIPDRIDGNLPKGIYIKNGKKFVVR